MSGAAVSVALPLPVQTVFTYGVGARPLPARGVRVVVPFGPRKVVGVVTGPAATSDGRALKDVLDVLDEAPLIAPPLLDLVDWMAEHYLAPPGECLRLALPPSGIRASRAIVRLAKLPAGVPLDTPAADEPVVAALRSGPLRLSTLASRLGHDPAGRIARLRRDGVVEVEQDLRTPGFRQIRWAALDETVAASPKGKAQAEILDRLRAAGGRMPVPDLVRGRSSLRGSLERLAATGAVRIVEERADRAPRAGDATNAARPQPTRDQAAVLDAILPALDARAFRAFLLHGVTGSGKTEVYFRAAERALGQDRGVLILVPEIGLTPLPRPRGRGALRRDRLRDPQRALRGRASRPVVAHPRGGVPRGRGRAVGGLRAHPGPGPGRGGRGARRRVQAGGRAAVPRPRRGRDARQAGGRGRDPGLGHAVRRDLHERPAGQVRAAGAPAAHQRAGAPARRRRGPAAGAEGGRRSRSSRPRCATRSRSACTGRSRRCCS